jgi:ribonuclease HI
MESFLVELQNHGRVWTTWEPQIHYKASNNGAEYEALIHELRIALSLGIKLLLAFGDSKVVIEQVNKEWYCVKDTMDAYCVVIRKLEGHFEGIEF